MDPRRHGALIGWLWGVLPAHAAFSALLSLCAPTCPIPPTCLPAPSHPPQATLAACNVAATLSGHPVWNKPDVLPFVDGPFDQIPKVNRGSAGHWSRLARAAGWVAGDGMLLANCTAAHVHLGVHHRSCSETRS